MGYAYGTGDMVDIEDNYAGVTNGIGKGLGIYGQFIGAVSFYSNAYQTNYLDVTDYLKSVASGSTADVTFVIVRIVRYNVNEYDNPYYYNLGVYHYDDRIVEIGTKENTNPDLRPALVLTENCYFDFNDLAGMANAWLTNDSVWDIAPLPSGDGIVDLTDFSLLSDCWNNQ